MPKEITSHNGLIIALDVVKYSKNVEDTILDIFTQLYKLSDSIKKKLIGIPVSYLSTGDGMIFIIHPNNDYYDLKRVIHVVIKSFAKWTESNKIKIRVGIHQGNYYEVKDYKNFCGTGINECVRYMSAADENQIIISSDVHNRGTGDSFVVDKVRYTLSEKFVFFDKNKIKHEAYVLGYAKIFSNKLPDAARNHRIHLDMRNYENAIQGIDQNVLKSRVVSIFGLTFASLANAISEDSFSKSKIEELNLFMYAPKIIVKHHPNIFLYGENHKFPVTIQEELKKSLNKIIKNVITQPKIKNIDLYIMNQSPTFTGEYLVFDEKKKMIRITPIFWGVDTKDIPKMIINSENESDPVFYKYEKYLNEIKNQNTTIRFCLKQETDDEIWCRFNLEQKKKLDQEIKDFIEYLKKINPEFKCCSHSEHTVKFITNKKRNIANIDKDHVLRFYKDCKETGFNNLNFEKHDMFLLECLDKKPYKFLRRKAIVKEKHIIATFAVIYKAEENKKILLINKQKAGWSYDVPGGKFNMEDASLPNCLSRELFEELGIIIDFNRLKQGYIKYDAASKKENSKPVIPVYYEYPLQNDETLHLEKLDADTKSNKLRWFDIDDLIKELDLNGNFCHIPKEYLLKINQQNE